MNYPESELDVYLVGGAVRDSLLQREVHDRDWVVVGSDVATMIELGFTQVGRDFPVFLHPTTHDEYALARTERKQGTGHRGFSVFADPSVTLEQDLARRDLTINAIAQSPGGELIDPFDGVTDLRRGVLRHVSDAFVEDPLRVLRVARFAAQFEGFVIAEDTARLMQRMCGAGELRHLAAERVWVELEKALAASAPERFFSVLENCGGMEDWLVELQGVAVAFAAERDPAQRYALLPLTMPDFETLSARLKVPSRYLRLARDQQLAGSALAQWRSLPAVELLKVLDALRAWQDPLRVQALLELNNADRRLLDVVARLRSVSLGEVPIRGPEYGRLLGEKRLAVLQQQLDQNA